MNLNLTGKVVVITGGGQGIGKGTALEFAREGCKVAICGRTAKTLEAAKRELEALKCSAYMEVVDVSNISATEAFANRIMETWGGIDIWVNNAAIAFDIPIENVTEQNWDSMMSINLKAVYFNSRTAARCMCKGKKGGVIINVSSFGAVVPNPSRAIYGAAKSGVNSLTRSFAANYAPYGIRVVSVLPGPTDTEMNRMLKNVVDNSALMRSGTAEEIARPIVFMSSDASSYLTGVGVEISGGKLCVQRPKASWDAAKQ